MWHAMEQQIEEHNVHYAKQNGFVGPVGPTITEEGWEDSWPEEPAEPTTTQPQHVEAMETDDPPQPYSEYAKARTARVERAMEERASGRYEPPIRKLKGSGKGRTPSGRPKSPSNTTQDVAHMRTIVCRTQLWSPASMDHSTWRACASGRPLEYKRYRRRGTPRPRGRPAAGGNAKPRTNGSLTCGNAWPQNASLGATYPGVPRPLQN